jgi:hypothetical protein
MTIQLFANNAKTTLASPVNATQTTLTVAPGTGALFPSPTAGQAFKVTLISASSSTVYEICLCTSRTADVLTVVRAQEGTTGTPFLLNDIVGNYDTAGVMSNLVQSQQLQMNTYLYGIGGGTANALTGSLVSSLTNVNDGFAFTLESTVANTGASTLVLTLGSTILSSYPIVKNNNQPLVANDIPGANYPCNLVWNSTYNAYVLTNPANFSGRIIQAIQNISTSTATTSANASYVTTGHSATITPTSSTSKILVTVTFTFNNSAGYDSGFTVYRGSTNLAGTNTNFAHGATYTGGVTAFPSSMQYLDSPAVTSSTTYTVYMLNPGSPSTLTYNVGQGNGSQTGAAVITLLEISQ